MKQLAVSGQSLGEIFGSDKIVEPVGDDPALLGGSVVATHDDIERFR